MPHIIVIVGSTRPNRFGIHMGNWFMELAKEHSGATFTLVDLADINLPFLDEPALPALGNYVHAHTKAWARTIGSADGFIFVTAEYNFGIPASLKNAIDFLGAEWRYKPVAFISYGAGGGGVRAVEQLRSVVANLSMFDLRDQVIVTHYWAQLTETGAFKASDDQVAAAHKMADNVAFWANYLAPARKQLKDA